MKDLTKYFIDLSKCSEEQQKHIFSMLPEPVLPDDYDIRGYYKYLLITDDFDNHCDKWYVDCASKGKTELTYPEFIKLFEGGEGEKELEVWLNRQIEKCQQLDMPREEWAFIQVLKKINSNQ